MINVKFNLDKNCNKIYKLLKLQNQFIKTILFHQECFKIYKLVIINKTTEKKNIRKFQNKKKYKKLKNINYKQHKVSHQSKIVKLPMIKKSINQQQKQKNKNL